VNEILSVLLGSMHADLARVERAGMNLANLQTAAYKRDVVSARPFAARVDAANGLPGAGQAAGENRALTVHVDQRAGTLKATGRSLDLAIGGDGWFEIATDQGPAYTRDGNFRLDASGRLVTQQGQAVMGLSGEIQLLHGSPVIDAAGRVFEGARLEGGAAKLSPAPVGQIRVVQFDRTAAVERLGGGLLSIRGAAAAAPEGAVEMQQGFLENSNVSHMHEMVRLMEAVRHLESMQKVASGYDEMLGTSIRRLGEP
jgi:flagellar basal-body rod protein FlgF